MTTRLPTFLKYLCIGLFAAFVVACDTPNSETETEAEDLANVAANPEVAMATDYNEERQDFLAALEGFYGKETVTPEDVNYVFIELTETALSLANAYDPAQQPDIAASAAALRESYAAIDVTELDTQSATFAEAAVDLSTLLKEITTRFYPDLATDANILHRGAVRLAPNQPILSQNYPINTFFQSAEKVVSGMSSPVLKVEAESMN